jgi:UDP-N-acetylmuramyl tripeptide synthase
MCCRVAAAAGLDVCGVDLRLPDIASPVGHPAPTGAVIEVNACPGLRMHLAPSAGRPRDVAGAIIDRLYPPGAQARIPVVAVTGTNGKTTTARMIARILGQAGLHVGLATTDGVYSGGRLVHQADASGPRSAEMVLDDPAVEAAVRGRQLVEARGGEETVLLGVDELPGSFGGAASHLVANALAAIATCRALGVSVKDIRRALTAFTPDEANPGRGNLYLVAGSPVIVDYGHNAAALAAMGRLVHDTWGGDPVAAITLPGDRRDDLVRQTAASVAAWFGRVVVYEDNDLRGRQPGEMTGLIS